MSEIVGDPEYLAPEIRQKDGVNPIYDLTKADIFAAGVILLKMAVGKYLEDPQEQQLGLYDCLKSQDIQTIWQQLGSAEAKVSSSLKDLIEKMLQFNPNNRISYNEIMNHDWLKR